MLGGFREQLTARCDNPPFFGMCPRIYILTSWQCRHSLQSFSATAGKIYSDLDPGRDLCQSITAAEFRSRLHKRAWGENMNYRLAYSFKDAQLKAVNVKTKTHLLPPFVM